MPRGGGAAFWRLAGGPGLPGAHRLLGMAMLLGACSMMPSGAAGPSGPAAAGSTAAIDSISLERGCFGCADSGQLVLHRDGRALHIVTGNARRGTPDQTREGRMATGDFERLAGLLLAQGFDQLDEVYEDPQLRDGQWVVLGVAGARPGKQVLSRMGAGPEALKRMVDAVEVVRSGIRFVP